MKGWHMARIRRFIESEREARGPRSSVDGYVQKVVDDDGTVFLHLYNYAEGGPKPGATPTQSIHLDYTTAKALKSLIDETFGTL